MPAVGDCTWLLFIPSADQTLCVTWCACLTKISHQLCSRCGSYPRWDKEWQWKSDLIITQRGFVIFPLKFPLLKKKGSASEAAPRATCHAPHMSNAGFLSFGFTCASVSYLAQTPPVRFSLSARNLSRVLKTVGANLFFDLTYIYPWCWQVSLSSHICSAWLSHIDSLQLISS